MPERKLGPEELRYIALFQSITGTTVLDCIVDEDFNRIIYIVRPEDMGKAIGRRGINVKRLSDLLKKNIEIVEHSDNLEDMVKNVFREARIVSINLVERGGQKTLYVRVPDSDKGKAIGREGKNLKRARLILKRFFDIDRIVVTA
ncbi:MAG: NusA-like transcription termination signal-binding factor [Desulfurococcales archaeon]|nr:NusA-like transcription termination signal-binding factor [Desulfurococcales archaeon]MEB3759176.1 NusA-like transcription termination signal-binding factor [Desulfurococcales archaeon]MEB3772862.1 NusA-like transcription termination signal-binding factor [Desulfurococcales archaeon]MEB3786617.1 NusA-like transcription termination signal-binding factor [Desulfurococcales archaeon]MEB3798846.1 NusA-like transcription termination signal-binding factor [Desulfurococcales archaeon]